MILGGHNMRRAVAGLGGGGVSYPAPSPWNLNDKAAAISLSESDFRAENTVDIAHSLARCLSGKSSGKWQFGFKLAESQIAITQTWMGFSDDQAPLTGGFVGINGTTGLGISLFDTTTDQWNYWDGDAGSDTLVVGVSHAAGQIFTFWGDFNEGDVWIKPDGHAIIGGGDPETGTSPTVSNPAWKLPTNPIHKAMSDKTNKGITIEATPTEPLTPGYNWWGELS